MRDQQPASVHLRRLLPLIAATALLGPGAAGAASPAPDSPPAGTTLAPDPVPTTTKTKPTVRIPQAVSPLTNVTPQRTSIPPARVVVTPPPAPKRQHRVAPAHHAVPRATPIVDVMPSLIDLHPDLGALPSLPRDDSALVLAAAALLAAAAAAGTGTMLTLTARVRR